MLASAVQFTSAQFVPTQNGKIPPGLIIPASAVNGGGQISTNLLFVPDNTYSIGAAGATRPSNVYVANAVQVGTGTIPTITTIAQYFAGSGMFGAQATGGGDFDFCWNCYYNGGWKYRATDSAGKIGFNTAAAGAWSIQTASSGSADAAISWSEILRVTSSAVGISGKTTWSTTAPTISSGFGGTPSIASNNGTVGFTINVGSGGTATTGAVGLPTATTGWRLTCDDVTTQSSTIYLTKQIATSTTTATIGLYDAAGAPAAWGANNILVCNAMAY